VDKTTAREISGKDFNQLIKYAQSDYMENNKCYVIIADGDVYVIPSAYSDIAQGIYESSADVSENVSSFYQFYNDLMDYSYYDLIEMYGLINDDKTYQQIDTAISLCYCYYDDYNSLEDYCYYIYGTDYYSSLDKMSWDMWQAFKKFYGYTSLEEYQLKTGSTDSGDSEGWELYQENFNRLYNNQ
jgi:hypothetical protein